MAFKRHGINVNKRQGHHIIQIVVHKTRLSACFIRKPLFGALIIRPKSPKVALSHPKLPYIAIGYTMIKWYQFRYHRYHKAIRFQQHSVCTC